jgi:hypothetical protein
VPQVSSAMTESLSPLDSPDPKGVRFSALMTWIDEIEQAVSIEMRRVIEARPEHALIVHQAEWHFLGVAYHTRNVLTNYNAMAQRDIVRAGVASTRVTPDLIITPAPEFRVMMFEFYALLNLARITLDNLRVFLRPLFKTNYRELPKSVRDFVKSKTDCPIYRTLAQAYVIEYLCDLRDYVVHYRSFATSENLVIIGDHVDPEQVKEFLEENKWFEPTARAYFRRIDSRVWVDVRLPDTIFQRVDGQTKLAVFTYNECINLGVQAVAFLELITECILTAYSLLIEPGKPTYEFCK